MVKIRADDRNLAYMRQRDTEPVFQKKFFDGKSVARNCGARARDEVFG
jgi:hypothetical protein